MAKNQRRRGFSFGTIFMVLTTGLCVALCMWVFPRIAGDLDNAQAGSVSLIQGLLATRPPASAVTTRETAQGSPQETPFEVPQETPLTMPGQATAEPQPFATQTPKPRVITINAAGQIGLDNTLRKSGLQESGNYHYEDIFSAIAPYMSAADATLVTLETAIAGEAAGYDSYNAPSALLDALKTAGVDIVNLATERILDKDIDGLVSTRNAAEQRGFDVTGAYRSANERQLPLTFEINGIKVACLSYTYGLSSTGSKKGTAEQRGWAVSVLDPQVIRSDVAQARSQGAHLVIVNVHWGKRSQTKSVSETTNLAEQIANCGADVILGTHPTSVHRMERKQITLADGTPHEVFIAYSLGNFLTNERDDAATIMGVLLTLEFTLDPGATQARLTDARYLPTWVMRYQTDGYHYRILPAGASAKPSEMTDSVYRNMGRAYETQIKTLGSEAATPYSE